METARAYLFGLGLTKAPTGKGRFSREAHAALAAERAKGTVFTDDLPKEIPAKKSVKISVNKPVRSVALEGSKKVDPKAVRKWAGANGHTVGERGRIHVDIINAYIEAHGDKVEERKDEYDEYRGLAPASYPEGTKFTGTYEYGGKTHTMTVGTATACYNCRVSLVICRCANPRIVTGHGTGSLAVTAIYPKG